jgi:uncharacterized protein
MPLRVNLRHLAAHNVRLEGELPLDELDLDTKDEMIEPASPLSYDVEVEKLEEGLLVQGDLRLRLKCRCVRCLKAFEQELDLKNWTGHVPLQGEEAAPVVSDCVDLTPYIREDILLEFPQHPLCDPECRGLSRNEPGQAKSRSGTGQTEASSSAWSELNKLKL